MADEQGAPDDFVTDQVDASGEPLPPDGAFRPEQPPMDGAAGGPDAEDDDELDGVEGDGLPVQGGE